MRAMNMSSRLWPLSRSGGRAWVRAMCAFFLLVEVLAAQDTVVVRAENPPIWGVTPSLIEEVRIGTLAGDEAYSFGLVGPGGVAVDDEGVIWVADLQAATIRRYAPNGRHLDDIGREGDGPGEFRNLISLDRLPHGRIVAWDATRYVTVFDVDGEYVERFPALGSLMWARDVFLADTTGGVWVYGNVARDPSVWRRYPAGGGEPSVVPVPSRDWDGPRWARQSYGLGSNYGFARMTLSAPSVEGYLIEARNDEYALHRPTRDGGTLRIERSWNPIGVKRAERRAFQELEDHFSARRGERPSRVPTSKPPFWGLWVDQEGRIWIALHEEGVHIPESPSEREHRLRYENPPMEWWEARSFDVIESGGRFLGRLRFPNPQTDIAVARDNRIWVVERGELGEFYIVRYRVEGGQGGQSPLPN